MTDTQILELQAAFKIVGLIHNAAEHDHRVDDRRRNAELLTQFVIDMAANGHIFRYVAILDRERTGAIAHFPFLVERNVATLAHVFLTEHARALIEDLFIERLDANADRVSERDLFVVELILHFRDRRTEAVAVDAVVVLVHMEHRVEVLHQWKRPGAYQEHG